MLLIINKQIKIMEIKEFIRLTLDEVKDKKWLKKVDLYDEIKLGFYEPNWFTSFFWESVECIEDNNNESLLYVDDIRTFLDIDHKLEERILIIKDKRNSLLYGLKYESNSEGRRLYNNCKFQVVEEKTKTVTYYE